MKKNNRKQKQSTFNAKIDIVTNPDNIKLYSKERKDYTELVFDAIKNKPSTIKYISENYKDYDILCEEAINQDVNVLPLIKNTVSNYKKLAIKSITTKSSLVEYIEKNSKDYLFLWKLAISLCYKNIKLIDEEKSELFPLIEESIKKEPYAIYYVDSNISIYSKLCRIAYTKINDTINYMNINKVDKEIMLDSMKKYPNNIKNLNSANEDYLEASEIALKSDGTLIKYIDCYILKDNQEAFNHLLNIGMENNPEIVDYSSIILMFCIYNRKQKEILETTNNNSDNNIKIIIKKLDEEYKKLKKSFIEADRKERNESKNNSSIFNFSNNECPIMKIKTRKI